MSSAQPAQRLAPQGGTPWYGFPFYTEALSDGQSIAVPFHTPVSAPFVGTVTRANYGATGGQVDVTMADGSAYSFVHLDSIDSAIVPGAPISPGQFVGLSGGENAGYPGALHPATPQYSTGPHIDFDIWTAGAWSSTPLPNVAAQALKTFQSGGIVGGTGGASSGSSGNSGSSGGVIGQTLSQPSPGGAQGGSNPGGGILPAHPAFPGLTNPLDIIGAFLQTLGTLKDWLSNPQRIAKFAAGIMLIGGSMVLAFLPDIAAAGTSAAGYPEFAGAAASLARGKPKAATQQGIRQTGSSILGAQRAHEREIATQQKAYAAALRKADVAAQRAETTRKLRSNQSQIEQVQRAAATTTRLGDQEVASATGRSRRAVGRERQGAAATRAAHTYEYSPRINSGPAGFGGFGVDNFVEPPEVKGGRVIPKVRRVPVTTAGTPATPPAVKAAAPAAKTKAIDFSDPLAFEAMEQAAKRSKPASTVKREDVLQLPINRGAGASKMRPRTRREQMADIAAQKAMLGTPQVTTNEATARRNWLRKWARRIAKTRPKGV